MSNEELVSEIAGLFVDILQLEITPEEINPEDPLFGNEGLGLDSIDALEVALAISKKYGFEIKSNDAQRFNIFANLNALADYVAEHRSNQKI